MLEDDVTASEAQKRYEKYLQRFSKSDDVLFFEAHKDEEWFQERYDPIIIEKSIEARRRNARENYWRFYEQFLCDGIPEVHDNLKDFQPVPDTAAPANTTTNTATDSDAKPNTTTTTTLSAADTDKDASKSGQSANADHAASGVGVPDDGKIRLPKYVDPLFADSYVPQLREASPPDRDRRPTGSSTAKCLECYDNSVFIQGIPLHIQRSKIYTPFSSCTGFVKLILSDPIRNSRKVRYGWVTFDCQANCRKALRDVAEGGLNGHQLTWQYFMNLLPKQKSRRRPKLSPPESLYPHRVQRDYRKALECANKFDAEACITNNPLFTDAVLGALCEIRKLNLVLLYLRRIHFLCYYCGKHFLSEEHLFARCSAMHERKVPADISLAISGNIGNIEESGHIVKKEKTTWEKELDQRIADVVSMGASSGSSSSWIERKQTKMLVKNVKKVSEGKFRCTICAKLFKAEVYVTKHIKNK